jgi:hypothetical protein
MCVIQLSVLTVVYFILFHIMYNATVSYLSYSLATLNIFCHKVFLNYDLSIPTITGPLVFALFGN